MSQYSTTSLAERVRGWDETWSLAVVFGLASIPWTYAFVAGLEIPLWPSFIASATFYAAGGGLLGLSAILEDPDVELAARQLAPLSPRDANP